MFPYWSHCFPIRSYPDNSQNLPNTMSLDCHRPAGGHREIGGVVGSAAPVGRVVQCGEQVGFCAASRARVDPRGDVRKFNALATAWIAIRVSARILPPFQAELSDDIGTDRRALVGITPFLFEITPALREDGTCGLRTTGGPCSGVSAQTRIRVEADGCAVFNVYEQNKREAAAVIAVGKRDVARAECGLGNRYSGGQ